MLSFAPQILERWLCFIQRARVRVHEEEWLEKWSCLTWQKKKFEADRKMWGMTGTSKSTKGITCKNKCTPFCFPGFSCLLPKHVILYYFISLISTISISRHLDPYYPSTQKFLNSNLICWSCLSLYFSWLKRNNYYCCFLNL